MCVPAPIWGPLFSLEDPYQMQLWHCEGSVLPRMASPSHTAKSLFSSLFYFLEFYSRRRRKNSALVIILPTVPHRGGWSLPFYEFLPERMAALAQRLGIM